MHKVFGTKENVQYADRPGAYLIPIRDGQVGLVQTPKGYFLLGGGLEGSESHIACIQRECMEEVGCRVLVKQRLCSAESYCLHSQIGYFHPVQTYYLGDLEAFTDTPSESDHRFLWLPLPQAQGNLFSQMQNWALEQAIAHR